VRKLAISAAVLTLWCLAAVPAFGQIQDAELNVNGNTYSFVSGVLGAPGVNGSGLNTMTGVGAISVSVLGTSCSSCNVDLWFWDPAGVPQFDEWGATSGTLASGQSWQIDAPPASDTADSNRVSTILANTDGNSLDDTNHVPGTASNFGGNCSGSDCDGPTSMALGFNFKSPGSGFKEVITFDLSTTGCQQSASICLEDINPDTDTTIYFTGVASVVKVGVPTTPEPGTLLLLGTGLSALLGLRKKL
jgi:hypothetical protein